MNEKPFKIKGLMFCFGFFCGAIFPIQKLAKYYPTIRHWLLVGYEPEMTSVMSRNIKSLGQVGFETVFYLCNFFKCFK
jgi:hypothetical protein